MLTYSSVSGDVLGKLHTDFDGVEGVADQGLHETSGTSGDQVGERRFLFPCCHYCGIICVVV